MVTLNNNIFEEEFIILDKKALLKEIDDDLIDEYVDINNSTINDNYQLFTTKEYIFENMKSYKFCWHNVFNQFMLDFPRMTMMINKIPIDNRILFLQKITEYMNNPKYKNFTYNINGYNTDLILLTILLSTQSSFFQSFSTIQELYQDKYNSNILLTDSSESDKGICIDFDEEISITFYSTFKLINLEMNEVVNYIKTDLVLTTNNMQINPYGMLIWK